MHSLLINMRLPTVASVEDRVGSTPCAVARVALESVASKRHVHTCSNGRHREYVQCARFTEMAEYHS